MLSINERKILNMIWRQGPLARNIIAQKTGLNPATVTRITRRLDELGLIGDSVERDGSRGQPSRPLHIRKNGAAAIGVCFTEDELTIGLTDLSGRLIGIKSTKLKDLKPTTIGQSAATTYTALIRRHRVTKKSIVGIGFSLPGDFDRGGKLIAIHGKFAELLDIELFDDLTKKIDIPVFCENEAACGALGESVHGAGAPYSSFAYVNITYGVGCGIIYEGRLMRGHYGNAGGLGAYFPNDKPRPTALDLCQYLKKSNVKITQVSDLESIDPSTCKPGRVWIRRAANQLREGFHVLARVLDPDAILLGGLPDKLLDALIDEIERKPIFPDYASKIPCPPILRPALGEHAALIGAASVPIFHKLLDSSATVMSDNYTNGQMASRT